MISIIMYILSTVFLAITVICWDDKDYQLTLQQKLIFFTIYFLLKAIYFKL
jgi:hypothetical protein